MITIPRNNQLPAKHSGQVSDNETLKRKGLTISKAAKELRIKRQHLRDFRSCSTLDEYFEYNSVCQNASGILPNYRKYNHDEKQGSATRVRRGDLVEKTFVVRLINIEFDFTTAMLLSNENLTKREV